MRSISTRRRGRGREECKRIEGCFVCTGTVRRSTRTSPECRGSGEVTEWHVNLQWMKGRGEAR